MLSIATDDENLRKYILIILYFYTHIINHTCNFFSGNTFLTPHFIERNYRKAYSDLTL